MLGIAFAAFRLFFPGKSSGLFSRSEMNSFRHYLRFGSLCPVLSFPISGLQSAFHQNRTAFLQILADRVRLLAENDDIVKLDFLLFFSLLVSPNSVGGDSKIRHQRTGRKSFQLRISG